MTTTEAGLTESQIDKLLREAEERLAEKHSLVVPVASGELLQTPSAQRAATEAVADAREEAAAPKKDDVSLRIVKAEKRKDKKVCRGVVFGCLVLFVSALLLALERMKTIPLELRHSIIPLWEHPLHTHDFYIHSYSDLVSLWLSLGDMPTFCGPLAHSSANTTSNRRAHPTAPAPTGMVSPRPS